MADMVQELWEVPPRERRVLIDNLLRLSHGEHSRSLVKAFQGVKFRLCESPVGNWNGSGRIIWQIAVDYSPDIKVHLEPGLFTLNPKPETRNPRP